MCATTGSWCHFIGPPCDRIVPTDISSAISSIKSTMPMKCLQQQADFIGKLLRFLRRHVSRLPPFIWRPGRRASRRARATLNCGKIVYTGVSLTTERPAAGSGDAGRACINKSRRQHGENCGHSAGPSRFMRHQSLDDGICTVQQYRKRQAGAPASTKADPIDAVNRMNAMSRSHVSEERVFAPRRQYKSQKSYRGVIRVRRCSD